MFTPLLRTGGQTLWLCLVSELARQYCPLPALNLNRRSAATASTAASRLRRPGRRTAVQRERSVVGRYQAPGLGFNAVIELPTQLRLQRPIKRVADIAQFGPGTPRAAPAPSSPRARVPRARTCSTCSWLNPPRVLSLRKNRGSSDRLERVPFWVSTQRDSTSASCLFSPGGGAIMAASARRVYVLVRRTQPARV